MNASLQFVAAGGHVFAKVESGTQVSDGLMTLVNFFRRRRLEQPGSEGVFAHAGARDGEELEEASMTEDVEIGSVEVTGDIEAVSACARALPAIFDAGEAPVVKVDCTFGDGLSLQNSSVIDGEGDEDGRGGQGPADGEAVRADVNPEGDDLDEDQKEAKVAEADVDRLKVSDPELTGTLPVEILLGRR